MIIDGEQDILLCTYVKPDDAVVLLSFYSVLF